MALPQVRTAVGDMSDHLELGRITITLTYDADHDDPIVNVERHGEAEKWLTALGMLAAATDTVNQGDGEPDD